MLEVAAPPPARSFAPVAPLVRSAPTTPARPPAEFGNRFHYDTPLVNGAALPIALVAGALMHLIGLGWLVHITFSMWIHELGHAVTAWFAGFLAIPLPFITVTPSDDRNLIVVVLVVATWVALGVLGYRKRRYALLATAVGFAGFQLWMTLLTNPGRAFQRVIFSGLGGELILSTLLIFAFYQRLPWRWDFWRYPVLGAAATAFIHALFLWIGVATGTAPLPSGAALGQKSDGDVERMIRAKDFTERSLANTYLALSLVCVAVLAALYLFYLQRARRRAARGLGPDDDDDDDRDD